MGSRRVQELTDAVALTVDGRRVLAREGEPIAVALAAAGRTVLSRSVKYHRARGAYCYSGRCDGCLMRVDGVGNVMTCLSPARQGATVETQNVLGGARHDLFRTADWWFRDGIDHHHLLTRYGPVNRIMQKVVRKMTGLARLPDEVRPPRPVGLEAPDVLVVGGGVGGMWVAAACAGAGCAVTLLEEGSDLGGAARTSFAPAGDRLPSLPAEARAAGVEVRLRSSAVGVYRDGESAESRLTVISQHAEGLVRYQPRRLVFATGTHEGGLLVPNNDLPQVVSARGAAVLLAHGVLPGQQVALVGESRRLQPIEEALKDHGVTTIGPFAQDAVTRFEGRACVRAIRTRSRSGTARHRCDAVVVAVRGSGAYELGVQAGVQATLRGTAFYLQAGSAGETAVPDVRAVGGCTGRHTIEETRAQARAVAQALIAELAAYE